MRSTGGGADPSIHGATFFFVFVAELFAACHKVMFIMFVVRRRYIEIRAQYREPSVKRDWKVKANILKVLLLAVP